MNSIQTISVGEVLAGQFQLQNGIFQNALDQLDDALALQRPHPNSNHLNWLVGHLVTCRYMLANHIGLALADPNDKLYFSPIHDGPYPTLKTLTGEWAAISSPLIDFISSLAAEELCADLGNGASKKDLIQFFAYHEAYHLGQMGYARKQLTGQAMKSH